MSMDEKQTILIVDDSLLICEQIKTALKEESIIICEAHSGLEAQEQLRQCQPDLILLDVVLPDADGYELYKILQDLDHKNAVIIFLTSRSSDEDVVKGFSMGACDYIKKPFVKKELQSRIRAHLIQKKQRDDLDRQNRELRNNMEKLNYMAYRDGLTGLYNRRYVVGDLMEDMRSCGQDEVKTVFIMADIDDFKQVNDRYGHLSGDTVLADVAQHLCGAFRKGDLICRWGGDEYCEDMERDDIERRLVELSEGPWNATLPDNRVIELSVSTGIAMVPQDGIAFKTVYERADRALYRAKSKGKAHFCFFEADKDS